METKSELKIVPKNSFSFFMEKEEKEKFKSEWSYVTKNNFLFKIQEEKDEKRKTGKLQISW